MPIPIVVRSEYRINQVVFSAEEQDVEITALANGWFVLGWSSDDTVANDTDARFSIRRANGSAISNSFDDEPLAANSTIDEQRVSVAGLADGRMVYVWEETSASIEKDVYARVSNSDGTVFKNRFALTSVAGVSTDDQGEPTVIGLANGFFMVAFRDTAPATDAIRVQIFDITGNSPALQTLSTSTPTDSVFNRPQMALLHTGNVVVTWSSGAAPNIQQKFAIVAPNGTFVKTETDVNPEDTVDEQPHGDVIVLADGNFVIIFERQSDANEIQGRLFDAAGNALGPRFDISIGDALLRPATAALHDGRFMVVYGDGADVLGRVMFADGTPDGDEFTISNATSVQTEPAIATLADGRVVVSWQSSEGGTADIYAEIYDPRETGLLASATSFNDDWVGTTFADQVFMGAGNDAMFAGDGDDIIRGEAGNDSLNGDANNDRLFGGIGNDTLRGNAGDDPQLDGGDGNDNVDGGPGNDTMLGGKGSDSLNADTGNDTLDGGAGVDSMDGDEGDDTYFIDNPLDTIDEGNAEGSDRIIVTSSISYILPDNGFVELLRTVGSTSTYAVNLTGNALVQTLQGNAAGNTLDGGGDADTMQGFAGDDTYAVDNAGDMVFETTGNDRILVTTAITYTLAAGVQVELLRTLGSASTYAANLHGNNLVNTVQGNNGANTLSGGLGNDTLNGFGGADNFRFNTALGVTNVDTVSDYNVAADTIEIDNVVFTGLADGPLTAGAFRIGSAAADADDRIIYNNTTGALIFDSNGNGANGAAQFATLAAGLVLTNADFVVI